ncbi:hypothetical protein [Geomonas edaphica]|uniref:hypothetical protein n=1 Tax=Geomonas edaphica TaxID=2570226 RepID=UPI0010A8EABB|nr:hypothetical protein [Geomonas edaphica]
MGMSSMVYQGTDSRFHRIVNVIDDVACHVVEGRQHNWRESIALLLLQMVAHVQDEEDHLKVLGLPNYQQHCEHHRFICRLAARIVHGHGYGENVPARELHFLKAQWLEHVRKFDCDY